MGKGDGARAKNDANDALAEWVDADKLLAVTWTRDVTPKNRDAFFTTYPQPPARSPACGCGLGAECGGDEWLDDNERQSGPING